MNKVTAYLIQKWQITNQVGDKRVQQTKVGFQSTQVKVKSGEGAEKGLCWLGFRWALGRHTNTSLWPPFTPYSNKAYSVSMIVQGFPLPITNWLLGGKLNRWRPFVVYNGTHLSNATTNLASSRQRYPGWRDWCGRGIDSADNICYPERQ